MKLSKKSAIKLATKTLFGLSNPFIFILTPLLLMTLYYYGFATDRYVSEAEFTLKTNNSTPTSAELSISALVPANSMEEEKIIVEFLKSRDIALLLDEQIDLKDHYQSDQADFLTRLSSEASEEDYHDHFLNMVDVHLDEYTTLIRIETQAFSEEYAQKILVLMVNEAEKFINSVNRQLAKAELEFISNELHETQQTLILAQQQMNDFQNKYNIYSPENESEALSQILTKLESELTTEKTNFKELSSYLNSSAPKVVQSRERIRALNAQIQQERSRLTGTEGGEINKLLTQFTDLGLNLEFAKNAYSATLEALQSSKAAAGKKSIHLVMVTQPSYADEAKYPNRSYILTTALLVLLIVYGIVNMVATIVREHQD